MQLFTAWVVAALIWLWIALGIASFYPLIDGGAKQIYMVLTGQKVIAPEGEPGDTTPSISSVRDGEKVDEVSINGEKSSGLAT